MPRAHRDIPSFPTRRSSDLARRLDQGERVQLLDIRTPERVARGRDRKSTRLNSKSHSDLVCRLLREKKKRRYRNRLALVAARDTNAAAVTVAAVLLSRV